MSRAPLGLGLAIGATLLLSCGGAPRDASRDAAHAAAVLESEAAAAEYARCRVLAHGDFAVYDRCACDVDRAHRLTPIAGSSCP